MKTSILSEICLVTRPVFGLPAAVDLGSVVIAGLSIATLILSSHLRSAHDLFNTNRFIV
jgi:hypothetical protein